ncbi:hypothetical protein E8E12_000480 [Didymella heteroderae]|uniref:Uncharacterized protein n=1 Tax=Didymella heteroderae TaxID=1769908 RepID=A0A9P4WFS5_9PLEO|nr:hypothetical protein E8E12_000480 [Didymella heteroderae]
MAAALSALQRAQAARLLALVTYIAHPNGSFLLCQRCRSAVPLQLIPYHLSSTSCYNYRKKDCVALLQAWEAVYSTTCSIAIRTHADAAAWQQRQKQSSTNLSPAPLIRELPLCYALQCRLNDPSTGERCQFMHGYAKHMRAHCYTTHSWEEPPEQGQSIQLAEGELLPWEEAVPAQRLQGRSRATALWRVALDAAASDATEQLHQGGGERKRQPASHQTWADLEARLDRHGQAEKAAIQAASSARYPVHISPWVEKTGWATYLQGYSLEHVARLLDPPAAQSEQGLAALHRAFNALIESARKIALEEDQVNVFALHRVNSFRRGQTFKRPLLVKLLNGTYRKYKGVWRRLLSFVYRLTVLGQGPDLPYILTPQQQQALADLPLAFADRHATGTATAATPQPPKTASSYRSALSQPALLPAQPARSARSAAPAPPMLSPVCRRPRRGKPQPQPQPQILAVPLSSSDSDSDSGSNYSPLLHHSSPSPLPTVQTVLPSALPAASLPPTTKAPIVGQPPTPPAPAEAESGLEPEPTERDQAACLQLCIALLDHRIRGRLTDSIVVGFLAANGINKERRGYTEAEASTSDLSALIKLAQLLVLQHAVHEHRSGRAEFPGDKVAELQDAFMVYGSDSPINWILNLRSYGNAIRNNTTAAGWIEWSDDGQKLTYKSLELTLGNMRWAIRDQLAEAQEQLNQLLLLPDSEPDTRARLVPAAHLAQLKEDPGVFTAGHSFLLDPRNSALLAAGGQRYLLNRVRDSPKLRRRFFLCEDSLTWNPSAIQAYIQLLHVYLERLLLLIHIAGGQPARGTELLTLRWRNSAHGDIRSIFVDNGMLCFVTSYHKNYSTSSTTKIIHRYLPPEIAELLLYYLWLITPFLDALHILTEGHAWQAPDIGSYLWPDSLSAAAKGRKRKLKIASSQAAQAHITHSAKHLLYSQQSVEEPWPSTQLGAVIKKLLAVALSTTITVLMWRHAAIAMSRKHLPECFQFKRDYGMNEGDAIMDLQSAHTSKRAAISYARSRDEGPGFSQMLRDDYRSLSRAWHTFLGFGTVLPPRDSAVQAAAAAPAQDSTPAEPPTAASAMKRKREELERELRGWVRDERLLRPKRRRTNLPGNPQPS